MRAYPLITLGLIAAILPMVACDDSPEVDSDGTGGTASSGTGGSTSGTGGTTSGSGGTGGNGGTTSTGGGGSTSSGTGGDGGTPDFWEGGQYDASGSPNPSDGEHQAGNDCMNCHDSGGDQWLFGGTVYQTGGTTGAAHVQVGLQLDGTLYTTYSGTNGNFWVADPGGSPNWAGAEVRFRNANGTTAMVGAATAPCNSCHTGGLLLIEPQP